MPGDGRSPLASASIPDSCFDVSLRSAEMVGIVNFPVNPRPDCAYEQSLVKLSALFTVARLRVLRSLVREQIAHANRVGSVGRVEDFQRCLRRILQGSFDARAVTDDVGDRSA